MSLNYAAHYLHEHMDSLSLHTQAKLKILHWRSGEITASIANRLEHDCRHQSEQTEGRNIQDYLRVVKQSKPPTIRCCTHKFAAVTKSLKTPS